ncbi:hypothetical protein BDN71DRAFT_1445861 [Pleurotus eryngii]|uniref:Nidogen G2 beta-barrel domain-containing protein n=1 Tax=Pleurotus eryngii TaxID=5323 RepID=A0A9P5ZZ51_PLEER|nr:hypothetical protein BDN71DRAFT_1445861 [Pleurotus eryngii]
MWRYTSSCETGVWRVPRIHFEPTKDIGSVLGDIFIYPSIWSGPVRRVRLHGTGVTGSGEAYRALT